MNSTERQKEEFLVNDQICFAIGRNSGDVKTEVTIMLSIIENVQEVLYSNYNKRGELERTKFLCWFKTLISSYRFVSPSSANFKFSKSYSIA